MHKHGLVKFAISVGAVVVGLMAYSLIKSMLPASTQNG